MMAGEPAAPGTIALVTPDGSVRLVADGIAFGNGMAITADGGTLIVAESYGRCLTAFDIDDDGSLSERRVWADLGDGAPDGICLDAEGAVWYADVPNRRCVRVREGGEVLETIEHDRGCFACMLGGETGTTLFIVARTWDGVESTEDGARTGQLLTVEVDVPHAAAVAEAACRSEQRRRPAVPSSRGDRPRVCVPRAPLRAVDGSTVPHVRGLPRAGLTG